MINNEQVAVNPSGERFPRNSGSRRSNDRVHDIGTMEVFMTLKGAVFLRWTFPENKEEKVRNGSDLGCNVMRRRLGDGEGGAVFMAEKLPFR